MLLVVAWAMPGYSDGQVRAGHELHAVEVVFVRPAGDGPAPRALRDDVLQQRAAKAHVEQLQPAADAEHRLAGGHEGADERHFVGSRSGSPMPVGVQRVFAVTLRRHVVAALQHQAVQRLRVVARPPVALQRTGMQAGTITASAPPDITQCAADCSR
jgi:hypothetical protein